MRTKIFIVVLLLIGVICITSCQTVKDFYSSNKDVIKEIITIILDTIFENLPDSAVSAPSGDNSGDKVPSAIYKSDATSGRTAYLSRIHSIINSDKFWSTIDTRVQQALHARGIE